MLRHQDSKNGSLHKVKPPKYKAGEKATTEKRLSSKHKPKKGLLNKALRVPKLLLGGYFVLTLLGYQPVLGFPPVRKNPEVRAENAQEQIIDSASFEEALQLPHPGYLTTRFSGYHRGIDIATGLGMPVRPIMKGNIVKVDYGFFGYGHAVIVEHPQGLKSLYAHMGRMFVKEGQQVEKTTILGEVGMTGRTTGPHTHLEVYKYDVAFNPLTVLPAVGTYPQPEYVAKASVEVQKEESITIEQIKPTTPLAKLPFISINQKDDKLAESPQAIDLREELMFNL